MNQKNCIFLVRNKVFLVHDRVHEDTLDQPGTDSSAGIEPPHYEPSALLQSRLMVEVGWEVCKQVGGIYTVLRSKAPSMTEAWGNRYLLVGPYHEKTAQLEFEAQPMTGYFGRAAKKLEEKGIVVYFGRWLITGNPRVVLLDFLPSFHKIAEFKYFLWKDHYIESSDESEVNDPIVFGYLVAEYLEALVSVVREGVPEEEREDGCVPELPLVSQFHEWMAGLPVPEIRRRKLPVTTVFHTHATLIGRYLAPSDPGMYHHLHSIDPYGVSRSHGISPRYAIERAAAWSAHTFTTLSDITAVEAEHFLGRKPDALLPNGLNIQRFTAVHEFQNLHARYKQKIHDFVMGHFFPAYDFDLENTLYIFTSGRYEYSNKGINLFIEALARLNWRLKESGSPLTVVAFIITRAATSAVNVDVLQRQMLYKDLRNTCMEITDQIGQNLLQTVARGRLPGVEDLIDEYATVRLKRFNHSWKQDTLPPRCTHDLTFAGDDPILAQLNTCHLNNAKEDSVKVIYHPDFLTGSGPLIGLDYDQFVRGAHLGVFPSYYEPWGYTPLECAAMGIPAITSDLAGFGTYLQQNIPDHEQNGLFVVERRYRSFHESADQLTYFLEKILTMNRRERIQLRNRVEALSEHFDWKHLSKYYTDAYALAIKKFLEKDGSES